MLEDDCPLERTSGQGSEFGVIKDDEVLCRIAERRFMREGKCIKDGAFQVSHYMRDHGCCFVRAKFVCGKIVNMEKAIERFVISKDNLTPEDMSYVCVKVSDIKGFRDSNGRREVCIEANPENGEDGHAFVRDVEPELNEVRAEVMREKIILKCVNSAHY